MAITFLQTQKRQRYLLLIFVLIIFLILLIVWLGLFNKEEALPSPVAPTFIPSTVKIDWTVLEDAELEELQLFEKITPLEGETGRENPFSPY